MPAHEITLELNDIRDLFVAPQLDPFQPSYRALPGVEQIVQQLNAEGIHVRRAVPTVKATLILAQPPTDLTDGDSRLRAALARYCDARIDENTNEERIKRREYLRAFWAGTIILATSLVLAAGISNSGLPQWATTLLSNVISIFGSVALWRPSESLLFGLYPYHRRAKIYEAVKNMAIDIRLKE